MRKALLRVFLVVALSGIAGCGSDMLGCAAGQACTGRGSDQVCRTSCAADAGPACPAGQVCTRVSGCCSGTGCAAILVEVCCDPSGC